MDIGNLTNLEHSELDGNLSGKKDFEIPKNSTSTTNDTLSLSRFPFGITDKI